MAAAATLRLLLSSLALLGCASVEDCGTQEACEAEEAEAAQVMLLQTQVRHPALPASSALRQAATKEASAERRKALRKRRAHRRKRRHSRGAPRAMRPDGQSQAFVFLFEWSWPDVAKECEQWLGPKGFTAALVSPPNEHAVGDPWYTRYQPVSYNLTSRSGNEAQFKEMVQRCRAAGVGIYVDAVFNHCAPMSGKGVAGSTYGYRSYPLYGPNDFHHRGMDTSSNCGVDNYHDVRNVQYCDLQGMPDLCTGCPHVQDTVAAYINRMAKLGISGFRVDAAKHMDPGELGNLLKKVNQDLFWFLEVTAVMDEAVQTPMYLSDGWVTEFGFAATLHPKFQNEGQLREDFKHFGEGWSLMPKNKAIVFLDNQDTQRNGQAKVTFKDKDLYVLMSVFMLAYPYGYPKVMSSYFYGHNDQGPPRLAVHGSDGAVRCGPGQPWVCEHRLAPIANMVEWRRVAGNGSLAEFQTRGDFLSFCRGASACVAINVRKSPLQVRIPVSIPNGAYCDVLTSTNPKDCPKVIVQDGFASVSMAAVGAVAFHARARAPLAPPAPPAAPAAPAAPTATVAPASASSTTEPPKSTSSVPNPAEEEEEESEKMEDFEDIEETFEDMEEEE